MRSGFCSAVRPLEPQNMFKMLLFPPSFHEVLKSVTKKMPYTRCSPGTKESIEREREGGGCQTLGRVLFIFLFLVPVWGRGGFCCVRNHKRELTHVGSSVLLEMESRLKRKSLLIVQRERGKKTNQQKKPKINVARGNRPHGQHSKSLKRKNKKKRCL